MNFAKPTEDELHALRDQLPEFVRLVLGKSQLEVGPTCRANCINAALNFFTSEPQMSPYSSEEVLKILQDDFQQIFDEDHEFGDVIISWSRTHGSWDDRMINVHEMDSSDPDFPYGLIFDHMMVEVAALLVFHKPDSTLESRYEIDYFDSVIKGMVNNFGFETTRHRYLKGPSRIDLKALLGPKSKR